MLIIMLKNHSTTLYIIKREKQNFNRVFEKNAVFFKKNEKSDIAKTSLLPFLVFAKHCVLPFVTNETKTAKKCFLKAVKYIKKRKITPFLQFYKRCCEKKKANSCRDYRKRATVLWEKRRKKEKFTKEKKFFAKQPDKFFESK